MENGRFPPDFTWGASTASYQIEGFPLEDGACPSNWHAFTHRIGRIVDSTSGDLACDHYHRYREDVAILKELGVKAYRFSVAWPRIFPQPGRLNPKGLSFYKRLVDELLRAGVEPWITVFHWDMPDWLERTGGFTNRESVDRLVDYGTALFQALGDRVKSWITVNEPMVYATMGYVMGDFPPGRRNDLRGMYRSSHHLLLAHARLVEAFPSLVRGGRVGIAQHQIRILPRDPGRPGDRAAARTMDEAINRFYMDPLVHGAYPAGLMRRMARFLPRGWERDLPSMKRLGDYVGLNYYTRRIFSRSVLQPYTRAREYQDSAAAKSAMWDIWPQGIYDLLMRMKTEYGNPPCYVTENGFPLVEREGRDPLEDPERIGYLRAHIAKVGEAMRDGADCRGYFVWSLLDNFEWNLGLTMRFGLIRTDFITMERAWKRSARWYGGLIARGGMAMEEERA